MSVKFIAAVIGALIGMSFCVTAAAGEPVPPKRDTAQPTVTDGPRAPAAPDSSRVQTGAGMEKAAAPLGEPAPSAGARKRSRADRDARHCLAFQTYTQIIKCAEKYL